MNNNENNNGWGAFQNKKKEIESLKKQLVVQDMNKFGDVITLNKNNEFENTKTKVNPFRFPNKIKNEELQKDNYILTDNNEIIAYQKKLIQYNTYISENDLIIKNIQQEYEEQTNKLKLDYENKLLEQKNKYNKWCLIVSGLTELINDFNDNNKINIIIEECNKNEINEVDSVKESEDNSASNEKNKLTEFIIEDDKNNLIQNEIKILNNSNKKGRKKSDIREQRLKEGDTEERCLVEIDDILYDISYEYCNNNWMGLGGQIFMSKTSIVKHKGNIIDFTFDEKQKHFIFYINNKPIKISYKRPRTNAIKNIFNSDTLIRHAVVNEKHFWSERDENGRQFNSTNKGYIYITFDEYCIYLKNQNKFFKCDKNGDNCKEEYKTLNPFIIENYAKHVPHYGHTQTNTFEHLEYFCKKNKCFKSFDEIRHDSKIN